MGLAGGGGRVGSTEARGGGAAGCSVSSAAAAAEGEELRLSRAVVSGVGGWRIEARDQETGFLKIRSQHLIDGCEQEREGESGQ